MLTNDDILRVIYDLLRAYSGESGAAELAALTLVNSGVLAKTGAATYEARTITGTDGEIAVTNGSGKAGNPTISLPDLINLDGKIVSGGKFGGETDYSEFESTGFLNREGAARAWDDVYPAAISTAATGPNAAQFSVYSGNMRALELLGNGATAKEFVAEFQIYHSYDEGSDVVPHLHLYIPDDVTGGDIKVYCECHWDNVGDTGAISTATVSGTLTRAAGAGISKNHILSFGYVSGSGKTISSCMTCRIYRDPADAGDTFGSSVWVRSADVHIRKDTSGSREETTK